MLPYVTSLQQLNVRNTEEVAVARPAFRVGGTEIQCKYNAVLMQNAILSSKAVYSGAKNV